MSKLSIKGVGNKSIAKRNLALFLLEHCLRLIIY